MNLLDDRFLSVLDVRCQAELTQEIVRFARGLGFDFVSAAVVIDHASSSPQFITVHNMPEAYWPEFNNISAARRDPVVQHCRTSSLPISWNQATYVTANQPELWEAQAEHGLATGIAVAMHLPKGRHFVLGLERRSLLPCRAEQYRLMGDLQLFAVHAQQAATRVLDPHVDVQIPPRLTRRELEALNWTMIGKTAWETSALLGISERTAVKHLSSAARKLDCVSKLQAVVKALRLGLIH